MFGFFTTLGKIFMEKNKLIIIFFAAFVLRAGLVFSAYHGDLNNNISWATLAEERGFKDFYEGENWQYSAPNQPPLTILTFAFIRKIWIFVENTSWWLNNNLKLFPSAFIWFWEQRGMILLIKLPGILADLVIGGLTFSYFKKRIKVENKALLLASVWLFNPIVWYNSSIWGQTDSIVNLFGLVAIFALIKKYLPKFLIFMTLSLLFKGSLAIFLPVLLFVAVKQGYSIKTWIKGILYSLFTVLLISIWFHPDPDLFFWLIRLYSDRILPGEIGFLTANAFNIWWFVDPGRVPDSILYFGLTARTWGFMAIFLVIIMLIQWLNYKINDKKLFFSFAILALASFLFMTRIHERYLYPFFPPATILLGFLPSFWIPYVVLTIIHLLNLYHLFWAPNLPALIDLFSRSIFPNILALINIATFFYLLRHLRKANI